MGKNGIRKGRTLSIWMDGPVVGPGDSLTWLSNACVRPTRSNRAGTTLGQNMLLANRSTQGAEKRTLKDVLFFVPLLALFSAHNTLMTYHGSK